MNASEAVNTLPVDVPLRSHVLSNTRGWYGSVGEHGISEFPNHHTTPYCHRFTSAQNSRHIDRKLFKMRELRGAGRVTIKHIPGETNPADLFTKILSRQPFEKHRRTVLKLAAGND